MSILAIPKARITTGVAEIILIAIEDHPLIPTASKVALNTKKVIK